MIVKLKAFLLGVKEAQCDVTTHVEDELENSYEYGRRLGFVIYGR